MNNLIKTTAMAAALALGLIGASAAPASAITVNLNTYQTGENLGTFTMATLAATQVGTAVRFVLTNTSTNAPSSFISQLLLTYSGSLAGTGLINDAGKAASSFASGASITNASLHFQFDIGWPTAGRNGGIARLKVGDTSTFRILNTTLAGFFQDVQGNKSAMIHIQSLNSGDSTKYVNVGTVSQVPLPAGAGLLLAALGGLALLRRKHTSV